MFNGTQPSNEGCTNGAMVSGRVTIDCGQGTTLIDCDQGYNDNADYSDLSNYFIWSRNESVAQQVSITFRFNQQINISRITMFFWNSQSNNITVPNVRMYRDDYFDGSTVLSNEIITIIISSPGRTGDGRRRLNIDINNRLQFQYLRIEMTFYDNSEWIFLSEVQFCGEYIVTDTSACCSNIKCCFNYNITGNTAPYHFTQPSTDNDVQIFSRTTYV